MILNTLRIYPRARRASQRRPPPLAALPIGRHDSLAARKRTGGHHVPTTLKRELIWLLAAVLGGIVVLPLLVYATGTVTLGPYSRGGAGRFLSDFLHGLARGEWQAVALALAPILLTLAWRIARALRAAPVDETYEAPATRRAASERREPTL